MTALAAAIVVMTGGCAITSDSPVAERSSASASTADTTGAASSAPSDAYLSGIANGALSGSGNVRVRLIDGVAYVTGQCESAIDESSVLRALHREPGVERIENRLQRNM